MARLRNLFLVLGLVASAGAAGAGGGGGGDPTPEILVSRGLMRERRLSVGQVVMLSADARGARARPFRIAGVYEPTPDPSRFTAKRLEARMHLPDLLALAA